MAKEKKAKDTRPFVFSEESEAKQAALSYRSTDTNKDGKPVNWKVYKAIQGEDADGTSYVVARSPNAAVITLNNTKGIVQIDSMRVTKVVKPTEYVKALSEQELDELLEAIEERKGE